MTLLKKHICFTAAFLLLGTAVSAALFSEISSGTALTALRQYGTDPGDLADKREKQESAPRIRIAFSPPLLMNLYDPDLADRYDRGFGFFSDLMFLRVRTASGFGLDIYGRFTYRFFQIRLSVRNDNPEILYETNHLHLFSLDPGIRALYGFHFQDLLWHVYALAAPRFLYYWAWSEDSKNGERSTKLGSVGVIGGAGMEVDLGENVGFFAEYNFGYTPVGNPKRNTDGHQIWFGVSVLTSIRDY